MIDNPQIRALNSVFIVLQRGDLCGLNRKDTTKEMGFLQRFHFIYLFILFGCVKLLCVGQFQHLYQY